MQTQTLLHDADIQKMQSLIADHNQGFALDRMFYTSQAIHEHDLREVWGKSWIWAGHVSQIPEVGDFFLFEIGTESVIVVRDRQGEIRAHVNVCRHRGSRVCLEHTGNARVFSCPYHAWTYELHGDLRSARLMDDDFDRAAYSLMPVNTLVYQGLIFICLSDNPPALDEPLKRLARLTAPFGIDTLKVAHSASYPVPANWKLAVENYVECYHCAPAHKEYSRSHSLKDPASMTDELVGAMKMNAAAAGLPIEECTETGPDAQRPGADIYYRRYPLYPGYVTGSRDGTGLAPLLGNLSGYDGGATDIQIGPLNFFLAYSDYIVGYRFIPTALQQTDIQTVWMVRGDAVEGKDYQLDDLVWLWDVTTQDDERIIRHNQEGVNSLHFRPGPLSDMEWGIADFYHNYLAMVR